MTDTQWQISPPVAIPEWFYQILSSYLEDNRRGEYVAQLLWKRSIQDAKTLLGFLDSEEYIPSSPFAFGEEMTRAITRLIQAREQGEKLCIWGDFDADGVTATSVLWEGLGEFFSPESQLSYYIPHRFLESHGLNKGGLLALAEQGIALVVTCDTGSTNLEEIVYAQELGIDIIITDHHTLAPERPPVVALINPRCLPPSHPLYHLSGVAVAYKLVEALYLSLPAIPTQPLENLLDLVAIGLIADLVQLQGDCRYLAQKGIQQLQKQAQDFTRPGVARLLQLCKRTGDRQMDISFGIGPRINAVSRIHGDAHFCVKLLTSREPKLCNELAAETELANTRRRELQQNILKQVQKKLARLDLSTTSIIVLEDPQWPAGILGLVAGQITQEYQRPVILLSSSEEEGKSTSPKLARGSARSIQNIDLYQLVLSQAHLLHRFGGHPLAAGLSLPLENLPLFQEGINQQLRQQGISLGVTKFTADLVVNVAALGRELFRELKLLEPCGMGNPVPKLFIKNCWFKEVNRGYINDFKGKKVSYPKTKFELWDESVDKGFLGTWWGHNPEELVPKKLYDVVVELDYNNYHSQYEVRLVAVQEITADNRDILADSQALLLDYRANKNTLVNADKLVILEKCPLSWDELYQPYRQAIAKQEKLALVYDTQPLPNTLETWQKMLGIAKYLANHKTPISFLQLKNKLFLTDATLQLGLNALQEQGFTQEILDTNTVKFTFTNPVNDAENIALEKFCLVLAEERFKSQYFEQVSLDTIQEVVNILPP
jgi:single-stranded-DNA-specific exonuclease